MASQALQRRNRKNIVEKDVEARLREELERLKKLTDYGHELKVEWHPGMVKLTSSGKRLRSEVHLKRNVIYVYDEKEEEAIECIRFDFREYAITKELEAPYLRWINQQNEMIQELLYDKKRKLVEVLQRLDAV